MNSTDTPRKTTSLVKLGAAFALGIATISFDVMGIARDTLHRLVLHPDIAVVTGLSTVILMVAVAPWIRHRKDASPEILPYGKSLNQLVTFDGASKVDIVTDRDHDLYRGNVRKYLLQGDSGRMSWPLADAMVMGLRVFAHTGSTKVLASIGEIATPDQKFETWAERGPGEGVRNLERIIADVRRNYPFADRPLSRHANPNVVVMLAHAEAVEKAGRPVPIHAVRWLKSYGPIMFYSFLNAGRLKLGTFHAEGLPGLVEMLADGKDHDREVLAHRIALRIADEERRRSTPTDEPVAA